MYYHNEIYMNENTSPLLGSRRIEKLAALFLLIASVFVAFLAVNAVRDVFSPRPSMGNVISVTGTGSVTAIPDIAQINFVVSEQADTAAEAQSMGAEKVNAAIDALKDEFGIEEKDIKTSYYSVSPRYSRTQPCYNGFCPEYEQTIIGYTASQTVEIKVRDTEKVGDVLTALGEVGVSNISGPSFTIDDPDALRAEARDEAIKEARQKAKALAKSLGVSLSRVTAFWENEGGYYPYESKAYGLGGADSASSVPVPQIPTGENEISVSVNVSYEIR